MGVFMSDFFRFLRYLLIFCVVVVGMVLYSTAHAATFPKEIRSGGSISGFPDVGNFATNAQCAAAYNANYKDYKTKHNVLIDNSIANPPKPYIYVDSKIELFSAYAENYTNCVFIGKIVFSDSKPIKPCETPKTDDQCNKGASSWVEGNASFWASAGASGAGYKGCTFEKVPDGLGFKFPDGSESHTVKSTGSTGKPWCETTPSEPPVPESEFPNNPNLTPATDPKECKSGWIKTADGKYYCVASGAEPTPPSTNPDGSINSDKDGNPSPPDANAGKPPIGGGTDPDGGGDGECEGENCEGGGGTKPPARPDDPWSSVLDANDLSQLQADKADVEAELNSFYEQVRNSIRINIGSPSTAPMPSYGFIEQGGERVELSMSWLDSVDMEGRSAVILLCGLIAASIIFWGRP